MTAMTIDEALRRFLEEQRARLAPRTFRTYEEVIDLFRDCMNMYGSNTLDEEDEKRWREAFDNGDEDAFTRLLDVGYIESMLGEFLGYFMIRKVMAGQGLLRAAGTVTKKLVTWLAEQGVIDRETAAAQAAQAADAARDLPKADRLAEALHQLSLKTPHRDPDTTDRWVEEGIPLPITKVEPGKLWFDEEIGPLAVPPEISDLARTGWEATVVLAFTRNRWWLVEVGNVYP
ncbi:hypothetical protein [Microtetraspora malaysiensis]|uniref:hypothetical protein n=1 Tax=Microtetraspora malaysiensis TaxID=161358 RepID=UPI003D8A13A6